MGDGVRQEVKGAIREEIRKLIENFLRIFNRPRVEFKLSMIKLNLKSTHAPLRVRRS